jgi:assimilatory nitrate reductase electron transfer subunit
MKSFATNGGANGHTTNGPATNGPATEGTAMKVIVIGAGLAGHETVRRLLSDPGFDGTVTWFGAEADRPYNRVLLTDLLAGAHDQDAIGLPALADPRLSTSLGRSVQAIDRAAGVVRDGRTEHPFTHVVLATGADPVLPPVRGNAVPLRTLSDARTILRTLEGGVRKIAVLGGGPLGVQTACALAGRGRSVEILHRGPHLLNRWLDPEAGALLGQALRSAGISVHCDTTGSATTGGTWPKADLVVLACGTKPRAGLAKSAGLPTDRGVLVDAQGVSPADPRILAIGDCAQPSAGHLPGLALTALDQARRAAAAIVGVNPPSRNPTPTLLRLRPHGVPGADVAALRSTPVAIAAEPSLRLTDQHRRTHKSLTLDDSGNRVQSATLVGDVAAAAALSTLLSWPDPEPENPAALLLRAR